MNQLPKSDGESAAAPSILKAIRSLMPNRTMSLFDARQRAEVQAMRFLALQGIESPSVPGEIVSELPKVEVVYVSDIPASGATHWEFGRWMICIDENDHPTRQRFSMMHEYKHVLDHPLGEYIAPRMKNGMVEGHDLLAEQVANYFAGCVLMPKAWVKTAFFSQTQDVTVLARMFNVSPKAMHFRLNELGITSKDRSLPIASIAISGLTYGARHKRRSATKPTSATKGRKTHTSSHVKAPIFGKQALQIGRSMSTHKKQLLEGVSP